MEIKDKVVTWWIQNIILPRREIIDKPGFIVTTFTEAEKTIYLRDLFLPEQLFEIIETRIVQHYGCRGKQALYSAGKKFSYLYCSMSNFPTISTSTREEFSNFAYQFVRYIASVYAKQAEHIINFDNNTFTLFYEGYVICRHNGLGYIMTDGGAAGTWAYVIEDISMEGTQLECEGRGNAKCHVLCAPPEEIQKYTNNFFYERDMPVYKSDILYKSMNEIRQTKYAKTSLKDLLDAGFFKYEKGILSYKNQRFFHCEPHILDFLEQEICKLENGEQILFEACFEYGKLLQEVYGYKDYEKFIMDFFPALGFGEIFFLDYNKPEIAVTYYPWTIFSEKSKYVIFRGLISGIISGALDKKVKLNNLNININIEDYLTITMYP